MYYGLRKLLLYLTPFLGLVQCAAPETAQLDQSVNLAMRRTLHYLLQESGDSTSRIPAVQHLGASGWQIQAPKNFNYDRLPELLHASLALQGVSAPYDVTVLDCADSQLQLGYTSIDWLANKQAPCGGRDMAAGCYLIQVHLKLPAPFNPYPWMGGLALGGCAAFAFWYFRLRRPQLDSIPPDGSWISLGLARFSQQHLALQQGDTTQKLTYREAKLLAFLAAHPNQLLERERILESVWGEEGLVVGRSLDVFVSRLRKYLRAAGVEITAVHGVGYRLEIA
ncbi:MAG: winged helix-turn-helix domain-containing protein [Chitinophagales bacterium]|nr:winged helix-turn-helix domain-containing protein [Chitinophagales bacterium]